MEMHRWPHRESNPSPLAETVPCSGDEANPLYPLCHLTQVLHPRRAHGVVSGAAAAVRAGPHPLHAGPLAGPGQQGRDAGRGGPAVPVQSGERTPGRAEPFGEIIELRLFRPILRLRFSMQ